MLISSSITADKCPYKHTAVESSTLSLVLLPDSSEVKYLMTFSVDLSDV